MPRRPNWESYLVEYGNGLLAQPFAWGVTDCASIIRGGVRAMYEIDPLGAASWTSLREALAFEEANGKLRDYLDYRLDTILYAKAYATTGDVLIWEDEDGTSLVPAFESDREPWPNAFLVLSNCFISARVNDIVRAYPMTEIPDRAIAYRFPWDLPLLGEG